MAEVKKIDFDKPARLLEGEDQETLAAIDRGIKDADEGRTVPLDEVRQMIPEWIPKFESRKRQ
jgi:predicted transcriptional regulator